MKKYAIVCALLIIVIAVFYVAKRARPEKPVPAKTAAQVDKLMTLEEEFLAQLKKTEESKRTLTLPEALPELKPFSPEQKVRAEGRKKRGLLPLGVILWDNTVIYKTMEGQEALYKMSAGDFVKVYSDAATARRRVHPGVDVYLAATSKEIETAGNRFPDAAGWVEKSQIHVFGPEQAKEFTQDTEPMTLGRDPDFSTVDFYERAFKNPDPVVHRVIGPRLIALLSLHEDYSSAWNRLLRDPDEKIRSVTLATLRERGVGKSAPLIEDLINRLIELKSLGRKENDPEVALLTEILKESGSPRAQNALKSLSE